VDTLSRQLLEDAHRVLALKPEGGEKAFTATASFRRHEMRYRIRVHLDAPRETTLDYDVCKRLRREISLCGCTLPKDCPECTERTRLLVALGWEWGAQSYEAALIPASEPAVEGTRTVLDGPSKPGLALVVGGANLVSHDSGRS